MKMEHIISKVDGAIKSTVIERGEGENCQASVTLMNSVGNITSDEPTGPDCDEAHERS